MDWTQTFTIILTIISSMLVALYVFYHISKEDRDRMRETHEKNLNLMRESHKEDMRRHDIEFSATRKEFAKAHALWAALLKKIHDLQLEQVRQNHRFSNRRNGNFFHQR